MRAHRPRPKLADSEVITMEIAGEFYGHADDRALYRHSRRYHAAEFPALADVDRSTFVRQAANLCWLKRRLQRRLAGRLADPRAPWLIDSFPLPACRFARARTCRCFAGMAAYGFDPVADEASYGFRLHLWTGLEGVILGYELGRQVLQLREEREHLLDSIWLATSPSQVRSFWQKVGELLGEEPTRLEREALSIPPAGEEA